MLTLDIAAVALGCIITSIALRHRGPAVRPSALPPFSRTIRALRLRHRRVARAIVALAHEGLERHPDGSFEAFTARETLRGYLPETLAAYLAVPPALRRLERAGRPSADDELSRQLRTLQRGLERIREADAALGAQQMAANGAFLAERFAAPNAAGSPEGRSMVRDLADIVEAALRRI